MAGEMTLRDIGGILPPPFLYISIEEIGLFKCCIFIDTPPNLETITFRVYVNFQGCELPPIAGR